MTGSRPGDLAEVTIEDNHFVCRMGNSIAFTPPNCPVGFCANANCTICTDSSVYLPWLTVKVLNNFYTYNIFYTYIFNL